MTKVIAILATMDTKSDECGYLRDEICRMGSRVVIMDIGVIADSEIPVDIPNTEIASRGGTALTELRVKPAREVASGVMVSGATDILLELIVDKKIDGVIGLGGTQGTGNCSKVMQSMPYGFPKLLVSTMASGDTSRYVGIKDITMMFSVSDILGLNPLFRQILSNAAGAIVGMAEATIQTKLSTDYPLIGITNLGCLTQGTMQAINMFAERGYETIVFHAVGSGGRAMEQLMREGIITAVFDYAQGDIVDYKFGGIRAADKNRMTVAGELGIPQVVVPGGIDHIGVILDEPNTVTDQYKDRLYAFHNPTILVPRTTAVEIVQVMEEIGKRLSSAKSKTIFILPKKGLSSYSVKEGELYDAASDNALFNSVRDLLPDNIPLIEMEAEAESTELIKRAVDELVKLIEDNKE